MGTGETRPILGKDCRSVYPEKWQSTREIAAVIVCWKFARVARSGCRSRSSRSAPDP